MTDNIFTKDDLAVRLAWKDHADDIKQWWLIDGVPQDIRYAMRNWDEIVLQKAVYVEVEFNKEIFLDGDFRITNKKLVWLDIPYVGQM
jgi:hypothetical protein